MAGTSPWSASNWTDAGQLTLLIDPDLDAGEAAGKPLHEWFAKLCDDGLQSEAVQFLAHALPRYECIVWATRSMIEAGTADRQDPLIVAILRWIDDPIDENRRSAAELAENHKRNGAAKILAEAVMMSGGSLAPLDLPPVLPPPDVCAKLAGAAILVGAFGQNDPSGPLALALELGEQAVTAK